MKYIKQLVALTLLLSALFFTSCEKGATNPDFNNDDIPRIFGWYNNIVTDNSNVVKLSVQVSPSDGTISEWFVDGEKVGEGLSLEYVFSSEQDGSVVSFTTTRNGITNSRKADVIVIANFEPKQTNKKMIGTLTRNGSFEDIDFENITHLVISSAIVDEAANPETMVDLDFEDLDIPLIVRKAHNSGVYVILQVSGNMVYENGAGVYADYSFYNVIVDPEKQQTAMENIIKYVVDNELDGIDIYYNNTSEGNTAHSVAITSFFNNVPQYLPEGPNGKFFFTASVTGGWTTGILSGIATIDALDWINLHAFRYEDLTPVNPSASWILNDLSASWISFGLAPEKIVGVFPSVGFHYFLPTDGTTVGWGNLGNYTRYLTFPEILALDGEAATKNQLNIDDGIFYDGHPAIKEKAQYVIDHSFAGLMMWSLESDSHDPSKSLLVVANEALNNN